MKFYLQYISCHFETGNYITWSFTSCKWEVSTYQCFPNGEHVMFFPVLRLHMPLLLWSGSNEKLLFTKAIRNDQENYPVAMLHWVYYSTWLGDLIETQDCKKHLQTLLFFLPQQIWFEGCFVSLIGLMIKRQLVL